MDTVLAQIHRATCLCLQSAAIKDVPHHAWPSSVLKENETETLDTLADVIG